MDIGSREFKEYVTRMKEIRFLSTPDLQKIENADEYSSILKLYRDTFLILKNNEIGCIKATRKEKNGDEQNDRR